MEVYDNDELQEEDRAALEDYSKFKLEELKHSNRLGHAKIGLTVKGKPKQLSIAAWNRVLAKHYYAEAFTDIPAWEDRPINAYHKALSWMVQPMVSDKLIVPICEILGKEPPPRIKGGEHPNPNPWHKEFEHRPKGKGGWCCVGDNLGKEEQRPLSINQVLDLFESRFKRVLKEEVDALRQSLEVVVDGR